ncbi:hypothetical protein VB636_09925 [Paracoccus sp. APAP_BH8]
MSAYLDTARRVIRTEAEGLALRADGLGDIATLRRAYRLEPGRDRR